jgi:ABC-type Mn2+/Zn2+ transport system ATPase subunit
MITHDLDHHNLIGNKIISLQEEEVFYGTTKQFIRRVHHDE